METQKFQPNKGFRLLKFEDIEPKIDSSYEHENEQYPDDPLEEMLFGVELNRELSLTSRNTKSIDTAQGKLLEKKLKHLRFYVNEISNHFGLDEKI